MTESASKNISFEKTPVTFLLATAIFVAGVLVIILTFSDSAKFSIASIIFFIPPMGYQVPSESPA